MSTPSETYTARSTVVSFRAVAAMRGRLHSGHNSTGEWKHTLHPNLPGGFEDPDGEDPFLAVAVQSRAPAFRPQARPALRLLPGGKA